MVIKGLVDMLVRKISTKEINPKTNEAFKLADIRLEEYKVEVEKLLNNVAE